MLAGTHFNAGASVSDTILTFGSEVATDATHNFDKIESTSWVEESGAFAVAGGSETSAV